MPLVVVSRNPERINDETLEFITHLLPEWVAHALTVPNTDGALTAEDVEIWVRKPGEYDVHTNDLEIIIWANLYPERLANLGLRREFVCSRVREAIPTGRTGFVWILLQPASFGKF